MPLYFISIVGSDIDIEAASGGSAEMNPDHRAFAGEIADVGAKIVSGAALQPVATATYLRNTRTDAVSVVDNPLPEAKEVVGGYYLIDAPDDATALALARRCPVTDGYVELRPVWQFN